VYGYFQIFPLSGVTPDGCVPPLDHGVGLDYRIGRRDGPRFNIVVDC
jgi:hypothetical protein